MQHLSTVERRGHVSFPDYQGERIYMREFRQRDGLPNDLKRWQPTVDSMLAGIETDRSIYLMVDQSTVVAGNAQRRPGLHIDGYWHAGGTHQSHNPGVSCHGSTPAPAHRSAPARERHGYTPPAHRSIPSPPGHGGAPPARHSAGAGDWGAATFVAPEGIILASSVSAARAYTGVYEGVIGPGGDCSAIDVSGLDILPMEAGHVYAGNVACLHESLPVTHDCLRTLVRLNVPGWTPAVH